MLYFEILWGRTATRWDDLLDKTRGYGIPRRDLLRVFDTKLAMVEKARDNWSEFASYDEDKHLVSDYSMKNIKINARSFGI